MNTEELRHAGVLLYGEGLLAKIYIQALAQDLKVAPSQVRLWWYGIGGAIPPRVKPVLNELLNRCGKPLESQSIAA
ncbi:MAG: hypothetical protein HQL56_17795 [Magnetococcales bacterium]|nr:hypothetical protein [Magnetococcales bacterium]